MTPDPASQRGDGQNRRQFLTLVGLAGSGTVAGCTGPLSEAPEGTADMPTRLWFETADPPADESEADPIEYASLTSAERDLVDTTIDEGEYVVDSEETPPALESFRDRIEARTDDASTLVVYLRREDQYYRIGFVNGDHVIAHPDNDV